MSSKTSTINHGRGLEAQRFEGSMEGCRQRRGMGQADRRSEISLNARSRQGFEESAQSRGLGLTLKGAGLAARESTRLVLKSTCSASISASYRPTNPQPCRPALQTALPKAPGKLRYHISPSTILGRCNEAPEGYVPPGPWCNADRKGARGTRQEDPRDTTPNTGLVHEGSLSLLLFAAPF